VTTPELARKAFSIVETEILGQPSAAEFEMAYQARVAADRIRFAIKQLEQSNSSPSLVSEASLQLADALDRLETADRHFQERFRCQSRNGARQQNMRRDGV
jgi:hypothetical protein